MKHIFDLDTKVKILQESFNQQLNEWYVHNLKPEHLGRQKEAQSKVQAKFNTDVTDAKLEAAKELEMTSTEIENVYAVLSHH